MTRNHAMRHPLVVSFLILTSGFSTWSTGARAQQLPVQESVSSLSAEGAPVCKGGVERTYAAGLDPVFGAVLNVLSASEESLALADPTRGLINSGSVDVSNERLRGIVPREAATLLGQQDGRYLLSFCLVRLSDTSTAVTVVPFILVNSLADNPLGGAPVASNGTLESEHLDAIANVLAGGPAAATVPPASCCESAVHAALAGTDVQTNQADHNSGTLGNSTSQSETSLAVFGSTIVVGWNDSSQYANVGIGGLTSFTGFGFSNDAGATFTDAGLLAPPPGLLNLGDPALAVDRTGHFYFASLAFDTLPTPFGTFQSRVAVNTQTATTPVAFGAPAVISGLLTTGSPVQDKELIAVDASGGPFDGRVYVAWSEFASFFDNTPKVLFARSTLTTPLTFATPIALSPTDALNHGAMPAVGPNGEVYVVWGRFNGPPVTTESIRLLKSVDGGVTFNNPDPADPAPNKTVASPIPAPDNMSSGTVNIRTRGFPYIGVDTTPAGSPTRGDLYIAFQADPDGAGPDRSDVFVTRSTDGGVGWSTPVSVNAGAAVSGNPDGTTNDNWQPSIAVSPSSGDVAVTFYDRRNDTTAADGDPPNTKMTLFEAVSRDAGLTWTDGQVSDVAFAPSTGYDPFTNPSYMGDYNYIAADASNFHMAWTDTRNACAPPPGATSPCSPVGRPDQDVFYANEPIVSDLSITKNDSPDPVIVGQDVTYNLTVTNNGPSATSGVIVSDTLPTGVTLVSATPSTCSPGPVVSCTLGTVASGASVMVSIVVNVDNATPCGATLTNTADVTGTASDPDVTDNAAAADTSVICQPDLSITKTDAPDPVTPGANLAYDVTVTNIGLGDAASVVVDDTLPSGVTFVSATPSTCSPGPVVSCALGTLVSGASATVSIVVTVDNATSAGVTLINTAGVTSTPPDLDPTNNTATTDTLVEPSPLIDIKPEQFPNRIRLESEDRGQADDELANRLVRVAILSNAQFNATHRVARGSLTFGHTGNEKSLHRDASKPDCWDHDVNQDGLTDLVCRFLIHRTAFHIHDTEGILKGSTTTGAPIRATDSIVIESD